MMTMIKLIMLMILIMVMMMIIRVVLMIIVILMMRTIKKENKNYLVGIKLAYFPSDISV